MSLNLTPIEWVKNPDGTQGYTWNPITGCLNGCPYCYARKLANGRLKSRYLANHNFGFPDNMYNDGIRPAREVDRAYADPFYPRFWEDRLDELNPVYGQDTRSKFKGIFVCDMSDLFGIGIPEEWTRKVLDRIKEFPYHRFYLLTKQPQNLIKFSPFPDNCWVGVTATDDDMFWKSLGWLRKIDAKVKYISIEPLLGQVSSFKFMEGIIDWLIIGRLTGYGRKYDPKIKWVQEILVACHNAEIPVFMKDNLQPLLDKSTGWQGWKLRQEMPR